MPNQRLDTTRRIATPEGIELQLRLAGPVARAYARTIDVCIALAILMALGSITRGFGGLGFAAIAITSFLVGLQEVEWVILGHFRALGACK